MRRWLLLALLLCVMPSILSGQTPTFIQSCNHNTTQTEAVTQNGVYRILCGMPTLAGDAMVISFVSQNLATTFTATDDKADTCSSAIIANDTVNGNVIGFFVCPNLTAGALVFTISPTNGGPNAVSAGAMEWKNIATSLPVDVTASAVNSTGTTIATGAMTTTQANDLICQAASIDSAGGWTAFTAGAAPWQRMYGDVTTTNAIVEVQCQVQTAAGAITPSFTVTQTGTPSWLSAAVALKSATAGGTPAAGVRILRVEHTNPFATSVLSQKVIAPTSGTTLLALYSSGPGAATYTLTGITDTNANTWTQVPAGAICNGNGGCAQIWYCKNCTTSNNLDLTLAINSAVGCPCDSTFILFDMLGLDLTAPFDVNASATGTQSVAGNLTTFSITPSQANGILIGQVAVASNTITGVNAPVLFAAGTFTGESVGGPVPADENNGFAFLINPGTAALTPVWTTNAVAAQQWTSMGAVFKAPAGGGGGGSAPQLTLMHVGTLGGIL